MTRYNGWLNERLYDACETLTDADHKRDRGAFFGSIHQTLHPGQVTTLLTQAGVEVGVTDRIALASSGTAQQSLCF